MSVVRFHLDSSLSPSAAMGVLTDFGPDRAKAWPTIDADHLTVHATGDHWADVTEGTESAWEHGRYEWDDARGRVTITTIDSKVFGPGGGWVFQMTPEGEGTRVDVELTRTPQSLPKKMLAGLLTVVGPSHYRKAFSGPFKAT
jgi:hypothetical protein